MHYSCAACCSEVKILGLEPWMSDLWNVTCADFFETQEYLYTSPDQFVRVKLWMYTPVNLWKMCFSHLHSHCCGAMPEKQYLPHTFKTWTEDREDFKDTDAWRHGNYSFTWLNTQEFTLTLTVYKRNKPRRADKRKTSISHFQKQHKK